MIRIDEFTIHVNFNILNIEIIILFDTHVPLEKEHAHIIISERNIINQFMSYFFSITLFIRLLPTSIADHSINFPCPIADGVFFFFIFEIYWSSLIGVVTFPVRETSIWIFFTKHHYIQYLINTLPSFKLFLKF